MYQNRCYPATKTRERPAEASNQERVYAEKRTELEALIERSQRLTQELREKGKQYNEQDPEERKRITELIQTAVRDAENRLEIFIGQPNQPQTRKSTSFIRRT